MAFRAFAPPSAAATSDDPVTILAAGVLAATLAAFCHETLGHGLGCIGVGGSITLLTSIWFRCREATSLTDAGGGIASLLFGAVALLPVSLRIRSRVGRFVLVLFGAISLFWCATQLIVQPLGNGDDWSFIAAREEWPPIWRPIVVATGLVVYALAFRRLLGVLRAPLAPDRAAIRLAYVGSIISAAVAGLMWSADPWGSAKEAFLTLGVDPLGLLVAAALAGRAPALTVPITRDLSWIATTAALFALFALVQGRGLGVLAAMGLPH